MLWTDLPVEDRIERIGARGLRAEIWGWQDKDLYHLQIGEGNLIEFVEEARCPAQASYRGTVAMEAFASADPDLALQRFIAAFSR